MFLAKALNTISKNGMCSLNRRPRGLAASHCTGGGGGGMLPVFTLPMILSQRRNNVLSLTLT